MHINQKARKEAESQSAKNNTLRNVVMADIIDFYNNPVKNIKKELADKEKELERTKKELAFFRHVYSISTSVADLLKLQLADLETNVVLLQGHLKLVGDNIKNLQSKLEHADKMRSQVIVDPPKKK